MVRDHPRGEELVGRPSQRSGSSRETLPEVWKWSGDPPGGPEVVRDHPEGEKLVGRPTQWYGSGRKTLPAVRK